jgi:hypothetical protein
MLFVVVILDLASCERGSWVTQSSTANLNRPKSRRKEVDTARANTGT